MGQHEAITSTARVARHRAEMRARGYRLRQMWVPDLRDPALRERITQESAMIGTREEEAEVQRWIEAVSAGSWDAEPDYTW
jgi:hypothetical protein